MIETLMRVVVNCAVFLELSDEDRVDPDAAVEQLEEMAWMLKKLAPSEQAQMVDFVSMLANQAERETGRDQRWQCLVDMPQALGLGELLGD